MYEMQKLEGFEKKSARLWLWVKPSTMLPLYFVAIVVASLSIHFSILTTTTWFPAFLRGNSKPQAAAMVPAEPANQVALAGDRVVLP